MSDQVHAPGIPVRGILSGDLSTATAFTLYHSVSPYTAPAAYTFRAGDVLIVYLAVINNGATASTITLFDDADADGAVDAGETLFAKNFAINEGGGFALVRGFPLSRIPKVLASVASVGTSVVIYGEVHQATPVITK